MDVRCRESWRKERWGNGEWWNGTVGLGKSKTAWSKEQGQKKECKTGKLATRRVPVFFFFPFSEYSSYSLVMSSTEKYHTETKNKHTYIQRKVNII